MYYDNRPMFRKEDLVVDETEDVATAHILHILKKPFKRRTETDIGMLIAHTRNVQMFSKLPAKVCVRCFFCDCVLEFV